MRLTIADHKRIMYWFHLVYKRKKPTDADKKTITKIHAIMLANQDYMDEEKEWYKIQLILLHLDTFLSKNTSFRQFLEWLPVTSLPSFV